MDATGPDARSAGRTGRSDAFPCARGMPMESRTTYCGACDRMVPVRFRPGADDPAAPDARATSAFLCLDYGVRCTGAMCPLEATPDLADLEKDSRP